MLLLRFAVSVSAERLVCRRHSGIQQRVYSLQFVVYHFQSWKQQGPPFLNGKVYNVFSTASLLSIASFGYIFSVAVLTEGCLWRIKKTQPSNMH